MKPRCFVILPLGHDDTECVYEEVYRPVIEGENMEPVRIDEKDAGGLVISQIYNHISNSRFIISDLTYERPNCYFETGYAIGLNRNQSLILCCRYDHDLHKKPRQDNDPKIHFDLQSYGIIWWQIDKLEEFRENLREKLIYRNSLLPHPETIDSSSHGSLWKRFINLFVKR